MSKFYLKRIPHSIVFALTVNDLYENHKTNFDDINIGAGRTRHTSLDWFLSPTERPSIEKASVKEHYIDIPGVNGGLDLTESLTGYPLYDYIEGSFEFNILNEKKLPVLNSIGEKVKEKDVSWEVLNRDIREFLNGKKRFMMLEDDPSWYYEGRFTVGKYDSSEASNSKITISYKVYPFKKLSTYIHNTNSPLNTFFDTISLSRDDVAELSISFWNKTAIDIYPGDNLSYDGSVRNELPCGNESVPITLDILKGSDLFDLSLRMISERNTTEKIFTKSETSTNKMRRMVLTNKCCKGDLYSDNILLIGLPYKPWFDPTKDYSKDECVSYVSTQSNIVWTLKAKEIITGGSLGEIDLSKWDVYGMIVPEYSESGTYSEGDLTYLKDDTNNTLTLRIYSYSTWSTDVSKVKKSSLYEPVTFSIRYDIGVM